MPHIAIDVAIDIPHSSAQNGVLGRDESVWMEWPRLPCSWCGCLCTHHLSREDLSMKTMARKSFAVNIWWL